MHFQENKTKKYPPKTCLFKSPMNMFGKTNWQTSFLIEHWEGKIDEISRLVGSSFLNGQRGQHLGACLITAFFCVLIGYSLFAHTHITHWDSFTVVVAPQVAGCVVISIAYTLLRGHICSILPHYFALILSQQLNRERLVAAETTFPSQATSDTNTN